MVSSKKGLVPIFLGIFVVVIFLHDRRIKRHAQVSAPVDTTDVDSAIVPSSDTTSISVEDITPHTVQEGDRIVSPKVPMQFENISLRRQCVQEKIYRNFGYDHIPSMFIPGCDNEALWNFDVWSSDGCGTESSNATSENPLLIHSAWGGPIEKIETEVYAMIDSFLMTQDTSKSTFYFWFIDMDVPPSSSALISRYADVDAVRFHAIDLHALAKGTCLEDKKEYLDVPVTDDWKERGTMGPKEKADMIRLLLLHRYGGIWLDTDSVILRDLLPLFEFGGEFAAKVTMSRYYNNNVLGLRKESEVSRKLLEFVCQTPYSRDTRNYCNIVGQPCYPKWYWNHGIIQMAVNQRIGLVVFPWSYTDPAYACFPPMLLSKTGGNPYKKMSIEDVLDHIRGSFVLHTRGYNAPKPLSQDSNFGKLYRKVEKGANDKKTTRSFLPVPVFTRLGLRNETETRTFREHLSTRGTNVVEPMYLPKGHAKVMQIKSAKYRDSCMWAERPIATGDSPTVLLRDNCPDSDETTHFAWQLESLAIRPALSRLGGGLWGRIMCMSGLPMHSRDDWDGGPSMLNCDDKSSSQQWNISASGEIRNIGFGMCLQALKSTAKPSLGFRRCAPGSLSQRWILKNVSPTVEV